MAKSSSKSPRAEKPQRTNKSVVGVGPGQLSQAPPDAAAEAANAADTTVTCPYCKCVCLVDRRSDPFFIRHKCPACSFHQKQPKEGLAKRVARDRQREADYSAR